MNFLKNLFKSKAEKQAERDLGHYRHILNSIPAELRYLYTKDGKKIPKEYHALNIMINARPLGMIEREVIKGKMHFELLKKIPDLTNETLFIAVKDLLLAYLDSVFYYNDLSPPNREGASRFKGVVKPMMLKLANNAGWNLKKKLDITFLKEQLHRIALATRELESELYRGVLPSSRKTDLSKNRTADNSQIKARFVASKTPKLKLIK